MYHITSWLPDESLLLCLLFSLTASAASYPFWVLRHQLCWGLVDKFTLSSVKSADVSLRVIFINIYLTKHARFYSILSLTSTCVSYECLSGMLWVVICYFRQLQHKFTHLLLWNHIFYESLIFSLFLTKALEVIKLLLFHKRRLLIWTFWAFCWTATRLSSALLGHQFGGTSLLYSMCSGSHWCPQITCWQFFWSFPTPVHLYACVYVLTVLLHLSNQNLRGALSPQISLPTRFWALGTCNNIAEAQFLLFISLSCLTIVDSWVTEGWCGARCSGWRPWPLD